MWPLGGAVEMAQRNGWTGWEEKETEKVRCWLDKGRGMDKLNKRRGYKMKDKYTYQIERLDGNAEVYPKSDILTVAIW